MWPFTRKPAEPDITAEYLRLADEGRFEEGLPLLLQIIDRAPQISTSWFNLGVCYSELGQFAEAAPAFLRAYNLAPEDGGALLRACLAYVDAGDAPGLLRVIETECARDPSMLQLFLEEPSFRPFFKTPPFRQLRTRFQAS